MNANQEEHKYKHRSRLTINHGLTADHLPLHLHLPGPSGRIFSPLGIHFDTRAQHVLVTDPTHHFIHAFCRADLRHLSTFNATTHCSLDGKDNQPTGITVQAGTGHIAYCEFYHREWRVITNSDHEQGAGRLLYRSPQRFLVTFPSSINAPTAIASSSSGQFYVADASYAQASLFDAAGRFLREFKSNNTSASGPKKHRRAERECVRDICATATTAPTCSPAVVLITDSELDVIQVWSVDGSQKILEYFVPDCATICMDMKGYICVGVEENENERVCIYDLRALRANASNHRARSELEVIEGFESMAQLCVDDTNVLMVCDHEAQQVKFFGS